MAIKPVDIVVLSPEQEDICPAVRYAIKSGVPYTYNRMSKDAWRRVARIARGKVNENLIQRYTELLGIQPRVQDKSHRKHDAFDFKFEGRNKTFSADIKTFHVLSHYISKPRTKFSVENLLSDIDHTSSEWHLFFPMLVPQDYKDHKDIYIFAVSVEAPLERHVTNTAKSVLKYPWMAFPDSKGEEFLVDSRAIVKREKDKSSLNVTLDWPDGLSGEGNIVYERNGEARQHSFQLDTARSDSRKDLSSFLAIQLDDTAKSKLSENNKEITLTVHIGEQQVYASPYKMFRFYEVFPRQEFLLYVIGWIEREKFEKLAQELPNGAPCYFYPPKQDNKNQHQPGTKTPNHYVLPSMLQPISSLKEV